MKKYLSQYVLSANDPNFECDPNLHAPISLIEQRGKVFGNEEV
jgi:hypothetical protein